MKIDMKSNAYTFIFAAIVCVVCSILLSAVAEGLKSRQDLNAELDVKKNILKAVQLKSPLPAKVTAKEILDTYNAKIEEIVIDDSGSVVAGKKPDTILPQEKNLHPMYLYKESGLVLAYAYPIVGQGLWSTLYGYFAMEPDGETVRGITFYKHGETPGLGAEIEKDWFQDNFKGKKIWSVKEDALKPVHVIKGKVSERLTGDEVMYAVDGITAATITSNSVSKLLDVWIRAYDPFFKKLRADQK